jgi:hypothetical protein
MAFLIALLLLELMALFFGAAGAVELPLVQSSQLRRSLTRKALLRRGSLLESFAQLSPDGSRSSGSPGHNATVSHIASALNRTGYYDVEVQSVAQESWFSTAGFDLRGGPDFSDETGWFEYSPSGDVTAQLASVRMDGCSRVRSPTHATEGASR